MSAYSMASIPHSVQPLVRASELPRVHSTKTWLTHCSLANVKAASSPGFGSGTLASIWLSISSYPKKYTFVMPDLLWSGWFWFVPSTLPLDASGTLSRQRPLAARLDFIPALPSDLAGGSRQGVLA